MSNNAPAFTLSGSMWKTIFIFSILGLLVFIAGLFLAPERIWPNFLINEFFLLNLGLGAVLFIATLYVSNAGWATAFRRVPEAVTSVLPVAGIGAVILIFGIHTLYEWSHETTVMQDPILHGKSAWLNEPFFIGRLVFYFILWIVLSRILIKNSLQQDKDGKLEHTAKNVRYSAVFLVAGVILFVLASIDLIMSLQPHWYSTVFSLITLTGMISSSLAAITILMVILRLSGFKKIITQDHLHSMSNLLLSFSVFWVYMWVSQHMLIWYSNIPEETSYYIFRHFGGWGSLSFLNVVLNWLVPFLVLLPRASKRSDKILFQVSVVLLIGHWLDLFIMVMPPIMGDEPTLGIWEIGTFVGMMALFFGVTLRKLQSIPLVPVNDPYLVESLPQEEHAVVLK